MVPYVPPPVRPSSRRALTLPLLVAAFALVVFEETFWRWAKAVGAALGRLPVFAALERAVQRLDPRLVFLIFLLPIGLLIPVKLAALWLIGTGHVVTGIVLIVLAKTLGTALSARLYAIAEPRLMLVPAFARLRNWVVGLLAQAHAVLDASPTWQAMRRRAAAVRMGLHGLRTRVRLWWAGRPRGALGTRFTAARRRFAQDWRR